MIHSFLRLISSGDDARRDAPIVFCDAANHAACCNKAPGPNMGESFPFQKSDLLWRRKAILLAHLEPLNELRRKASIFDCVRRNAVLFKIFKLFFCRWAFFPSESWLIACKVASLDAEEVLDGIHQLTFAFTHGLELLG